MRRAHRGGPFEALGLQASPGLSDDEVRSAWRRVAAATHPDREDGGDPTAFAAAAAAYTVLRTPGGRREALAGLPGPGAHPPGHRVLPRRGWPVPAPALERAWARARHGRPARLALRAVTAAAGSAATLAAAGTRPAAVGLVTGILTWLVLTARRDLASRRR